MGAGDWTQACCKTNTFANWTITNAARKVCEHRTSSLGLYQQPGPLPSGLFFLHPSEIRLNVLPTSASCLAGLGNHSPLQRVCLLSQLLFSLYQGPRQLSFVLCLNTEWQSTNRTWKNFGLSFCKSYCIKCVVKMAEWPIVYGQENSHRITMDLEGSLKRNEEAATLRCTGGHPWVEWGVWGGFNQEKQCC